MSNNTKDEGNNSMRSTKMIPLTTFMVLLLTNFCFGASDLNRNGEKLKKVSMIELIANPDKFDGQRVIVSGFVRSEFEGNGLYFHEEDYRHGLRENAVGLSLAPKDVIQAKDWNLKYCTVIGTYHAVPAGYFSLWSGSLSQVKFAFSPIPAGPHQPTPEKTTP